MRPSPASPDRPIFVVGHPRSGTTLLASMLGRHPDIASTPETLYLSQTRFQLAPVLVAGTEAIIDRIQATPLRHVACARDRLLDAVGRVEPTERNIFAVLLETFREERGKRRVLEKSPWHLRHIDELLGWFPDAKIIWIIRDGRACVASLLRVPWAPVDPKVLARQWVRNMAFGHFSAAGASSIYRVRYESLIADPVTVMQEIQDFVAVDRSDLVHDHTKEVETIKPNEHPWKKNVTKPLLSKRTAAWRSELTDETFEQISRIMNPTLHRFGYATEPLPQKLTLEATLERARLALLDNRASIAVMRRGYPLTMRMLEFWRPRSKRRRKYWRVNADSGG